MTLDELRSIIPFAGSKAEIYLPHLNSAMEEFEINTPSRQAAFIAQIAHESGSLHYVREIASGAAYDVGDLAKCLGNTPEDDGDGERYKGRGLIQITGRSNVSACSEALYGDPDHLLDHPEILELPEPACRSAAWFWKSRELNELADRGAFTQITRRINGGTNGMADRLSFYEAAKKVLT